MNDDKILELIKRGDRRGFEMFYNNYNSPLYFILFGMLHNEEDAKDVMMETFTKAFRHAKNYIPNGCKFSSFLFKIGRHKALDLIRYKKIRPLDYFDIPIYFKYDCPNPEEKLIAEDNLKLFEQCLLKINPVLRRVIELYYYEGKKCREIVDILDMSINTVTGFLKQARKHLKKLYDNENNLSIRVRINSKYMCKLSA